MEVTSGSVTHLYSIPNLQTVGQVDSHLDVVERATIYINSSTTFDYTFETLILRVLHLQLLNLELLRHLFIMM